MSRPKYIASCSGGKDSVATLLLAAEKTSLWMKSFTVR